MGMVTDTHDSDVEEVSRTETFRALSGTWADLFVRCPRATPFQSPAWLIPWWTHFASGKLWTLVLRREGTLIGLAAFHRHPAPDGVTRQITFVGTGNSDYLDILVDPEISSEGTDAILRMVARNRALWDECDLFDVREDSPLLRAAVPTGVQVTVTPQSVCPVVTLPSSFDEYLRMLPAKQRRKAPKELRALEAMGDLRLEMAEAETLDGYMTGFFGMHRACWQARGLLGVLSEASVQAFHRDAARALLTAGLLRMYRLMLNGIAIAYVYGMAREDRFYSYLGAYDPEFQRYSPGVVVILKVMEECIARGIRQFDFLRGGEKYKYLWGAVDTVTSRILIRHSG